MKTFGFFLAFFFPIAVLSQSAFKGQPADLDHKVLLKVVPSMAVIDKEGQTFRLNQYLNSNQKHPGKPFVIIIWGPGHGSISKKITDAQTSGLGEDYNVATIFLSTRKNTADISNNFLHELEKEGTGDKWDSFLNLATTWDDLKKNMYLDIFPVYVYTDAKLNVLGFTNMVDGGAVKKTLDYIADGSITGNKRWFTNTGAIVTDKDPDAYYYEQIIQQGDRIDYYLGTKNLVVSHIPYLRKVGEYLYDGILTNKNLKAEIKSSGTFKEGMPLTTYKTFYDGGKVETEYPVNGTYKNYNENGQVIREGPVVNGLSTGIFVEYGDDGNKVAEHTYKAGKMAGLQTLYESGVKNKEWFVADGYVAGFLKEGLQTVKKNELYGYMDRQGKLVIPLKYDSAGDFANGIAIVYSGGKQIFIDQTGKELK